MSDPAALPPSTWVTWLPAALRADPLIGGFLLAFERVLGGRVGRWADIPYPDDPVPDQPGVEERLLQVDSLFDPGPGRPGGGRTPAAFLPWLADMVAATLREDFDDETRRRVILAALPAFRLRGTRRGIVESIERYMGFAGSVRLYEFEAVPHHFQVEVVVADPDASMLARFDRTVRALIDQVRPAHTWYSVKYLMPTMRIRSAPSAGQPGIVVGHNTLLGTETRA